MQILVINVEERSDRRKAISAHLNSLDFPFQIVKAVDKYELSVSSNSFLSIDVERILESHLKCLKIVALEKEEYALIIEDDAILKFNFEELREIAAYLSEKEIVFLQLGFLHLNVFESLSIFLRNVYDLLIKINLMGKIFSRFGFQEIERAKKQIWRRGLSSEYILNDIRYGAHCYLVHASFARELLALSEPYFLSVDDLYVSLGKMKSFRMARSRRNQAKQSKSPSSVKIRFVQR